MTTLNPPIPIGKRVVIVQGWGYNNYVGRTGKVHRFEQSYYDDSLNTAVLLDGLGGIIWFADDEIEVIEDEQND